MAIFCTAGIEQIPRSRRRCRPRSTPSATKSVICVSSETFAGAANGNADELGAPSRSWIAPALCTNSTG